MNRSGIRRLALFLIWLSASAGLTGCGQGSGTVGPPPPPPVPETPHRITVLHLGGGAALPDVPARSVREGLELFQFEEGKHFAIEVVDLGGDPAGAPAAIERAAGDGSAVVVLTHSLLLPAATSRASEAPPIVFGILGDPVALGAGEADDRHLPGLTGACNPLPAGNLLTLVKFFLPDAGRVGVVFAPGDPLSVAHKDALVRDAEEAGIEIVARETVEDLLAESLDAACLVVGSPADLVDRATEVKLPVFGISEAQARDGAIAAVVPLPDRVGVQVGRMVHAILDGKAPAALPFARILDADTVVNPQAGETLGIPLPAGALRFARPVGDASASSE